MPNLGGTIQNLMLHKWEIVGRSYKQSVCGNFEKLVVNYSKSSCQPLKIWQQLSCIFLAVENYQIGSDTSWSAQKNTALSELHRFFYTYL